MILQHSFAGNLLPGQTFVGRPRKCPKRCCFTEKGSREGGGGGSWREQNRTRKYFFLCFNIKVWIIVSGVCERERGGDRCRGGQGEREREREREMTHSTKDSVELR